jgi:hypothetical protein
MSNNASLALILSGITLVVGYALAAPGLLTLRRSEVPNVLWTLGALPLAMAVWWCAYLFGLGAQSPFNVQELFILAAIYVLAVYTALLFLRQLRQTNALPGILVAVCFITALLLRLLTPIIGE